ncbi:MAG TPA: hypothetical protein VM555_09925 [Tahibacter sp.]|nr:hypothetical protein [Tahibacter sp.]
MTTGADIANARPQRWLAAWIVALAVAALALAGIERYWRAQGQTPNVLDSPQLWSAQRGKVYGDSPRPLVLLGASRTEYGFDMQVLRDELPGYRPVMLAVNGLYPLAALRDLAHDPDFRGTVICDVESNAFLAEYAQLQQPYVDYYHRHWTPSWRVHRALLNGWQQAAAISNPDVGAVAALKRIFATAAPLQNYVVYHTDRSGDIDYTRTDPEGAKRHFAAVAETNVANLPKRTPDTWFAEVQPVLDWARAIEARGGRVIFYESPISGFNREVMDRVYPPQLYWNRFAAASPVPVVSARDYPELVAFPLPDDSHIDYRNKAAYTRTLIGVLKKKNLLQD